MKRSIANQGAFEVREGKRIYTGFCQTWYKTAWQRMAGCGPTVVSGIVHYLKTKRQEIAPIDKDEAIEIMEDVWQYVKPTMKGIPEAQILYDGIVLYARAKGRRLHSAILNISQKQQLRPLLSEVIEFLEAALLEDVPVAFLNLNRGEEMKLDSWHWVTIVAMEYEEDKKAYLDILDEGIVKRIDFVKWYRTTSLGGGLVRFDWDSAPAQS